MKLKSTTPNEAHRMFRDDMIAVLRRHGSALAADEMLAVAAYTVGQLVALQDQRTMQPGEAMEIVDRNIELGNREAIESILGNPAGAA